MGRGIRLLCLLPAILVAGAADPPARVKRSTIAIELAENGSYTDDTRIEIGVSTDAAAKREATLPVTFSAAIESIEVVSAYTQKADGRRLDVNPDAIVVRLAPGIPNLPMFTDHQQKVISFPDAQAGDVLVAHWRRVVTSPIFPGQFTRVALYPRTLPWDEADLTITTPADLKLQTEVDGPSLAETTAADGRHEYRFHYAAPTTHPDPSVLAQIDHAPRLFASTFADWPAFSRAYYQEFAPKAVVSHPVQILADEVTHTTTDPRGQAELLYRWVSTHLRWGAIYLGNGPWVPHSADEVIQNGMGDCKDQVALFVALLAAKGIAATPVLVSLDPSYTLSGPATTNAFNHIITAIPTLGVYLDTTSRAPFGTLPFPLYGKPILSVTADGAVPSVLAPLASGIATQSLQTTMTLRPDGVIAGSSMTAASGPWIVALRGAQTAIEADAGERVAARQLQRLGQPGGGQFDPIDDAAGTNTIGGSFTLDAHPEYLTGEPFRIPTGLRVLARVADLLLGPLAQRNLPASAPTPCYAGRSQETLSLALPAGVHPDHLPPDASVDGSAFRYESAWRFAHGAITVERTLVSTVGEPLCAGALRAEIVAARDRILQDINAQVILAPG